MFHDPTFWVAVAFVTFVICLFKPIKKAILNGLDGRTDRIRQELNEALSLKEEAQELLALYQRQQKDAEKKAIEIVENAQKEAIAVAKQAEDELEASLNRRIDMAMQKIAAQEAAILTSVRERAIHAIADATKQIIATQADQQTAQALIKKSLSELSN